MKYILIVLLAALLGGVWWFTMGPGNPETQEEAATEADETMDHEMPSEEATTTPTDVSEAPTDAPGDGNVAVTVDVSSTNFSFTPKSITVKKGDRVQITLNNQSGTHDLVIDEFNVRTDRLTGAGTDTIEFVADKTGTFEYYCSVGTHRQMGMVGSLIVTE